METLRNLCLMSMLFNIEFSIPLYRELDGRLDKVNESKPTSRSHETLITARRTYVCDNETIHAIVQRLLARIPRLKPFVYVHP